MVYGFFKISATIYGKVLKFRSQKVLVSRILRKISVHIEIDLFLRNRPMDVVWFDTSTHISRIVIVFQSPFDQFTHSTESHQSPFFAVQLPSAFIQDVIDIDIRSTDR